MKDRYGDFTAQFLDCSATIIPPEETNALLHKFLSKVDDVQKLLERIYLCVEEVKLRHCTILTEITPPDYVRDELELFGSDIRQIAEAIRLKLNALEGQCSDGANSSSVYYRIQQTQHAVLSVRFAEIMRTYNQELLSFRTKSKERIQKQLEISGSVLTEEEMEVLLQNQNPGVFKSNVLTGRALGEILSRHQDILSLEGSLRELHGMFLDMVLLVGAQRELANNIADNVMRAGNYVDEGKGSMKQAIGYKKSWRIRLPPFPSFKRKAKPPSSEGQLQLCSE